MAVQVSLTLFRGTKLIRQGFPTAFTSRIFQSRCLFVSSKEKVTFRSASATQNDVAFAIANRVALTESQGSNLVLSPLSIQVVLSLVAAGSKGATQDQLLSFLKCKTPRDLYAFASELVNLVSAADNPGGSPSLSFANAVWLEKTLALKPSFKKIVETVFKAAVHPTDFLFKAAEIPDVVNAWIEKETNGLIPGVLAPGSVDPSTRLIYANALYFMGVWFDKFDASETEDDDFHLLDGGAVQVPFMTSKEKQLIGTFEGFKVLELTYKGDFSMCMFLPDAKDGLPALIDKVGSDSSFLDRHLPIKPVRVGDFRIPRFKISYGFEASEVLKGLGLELPFIEGGLTQMVDSPLGKSLSVGAIYHKSFINVNEEGTKAAAASVLMMGSSCWGKDDDDTDTDFVADHPFMFVIRKRTSGLVLFIGHVLDPSQIAD